MGKTRKMCRNNFEVAFYRVLAVFLYLYNDHNTEGSHNGIAAVLKTAGRKPVRVRIPRLPLKNGLKQ